MEGHELRTTVSLVAAGVPDCTSVQHEEVIVVSELGTIFEFAFCFQGGLYGPKGAGRYRLPMITGSNEKEDIGEILIKEYDTQQTAPIETISLTPPLCLSAQC